jgi:hypothetical protein
MKIRTLLILAATLAFNMMNAQEYQIQKVEPDTLFMGENILTITLNREIVDYDSITLYIQCPSWTSLCYGDDISWTDSTITASIILPIHAVNQDGNLSLGLMNTTDWSHEEPIYDNPVYIQTGISAESFHIQSVVPMNLMPNEDNEIIVTLNKEKGSEDSAFVSVFVYLDGSLTDVYYPASNDPVDGLLTWEDSTITAIINIPDLSEKEIGIVHVEMINKKYWVGYDLVYEDTLSIGGSIHSLKPEICMVSVDSSNRNIIIWEPEYEDYADSIIIYKETAVADEFVIIGKKSIEETSVFVDEESQNAPNSNRYTIAFQDTAGVLTKMSPPHKTMHLMMNVGINLAINLIWEKYEGFEYSTFNIYRGSSKDEMVKIAEIASNLFTFTDLNPSLFHRYYQVVIENPSPCDITQQKSAEDTFGSTKSNFVEYSVIPDALTDNLDYPVFMYPNPAGDILSINIENNTVKEFDVTIHDLSGRSVQSYNSLRNGDNIDLSNLKAGMYLLTVRSIGINQKKLIIKE